MPLTARRINPLSLLFSLLMLGAAGCMGVTSDESTLKVDSVSSELVVLGQTLEFYGEGFLRNEEGKTRLLFEGTDQFFSL